MSSVVIAGDTSGSITLDAPAVAGTTTLTLPATSGTVMVNGPAFFASKSTTQTLSAATFTKVTFDSELFDTNNNFSSSAFTPTVAGYYQISCGFYTGVNTLFVIQAYKNNNTIFEMARATTGSGGATIGGSGLIYCNGTTDYIELYAYLLAGGAVGIANEYGWFSAAMVRGA
jgi:hypothetical protein